jgi:predicted secreted Zn-dependent protease
VKDLLRAQLLGDHVGEDIEIGAIPDEVSRRLEILLLHRRESQTSRVFVNAEHHDGGLIRNLVLPLLVIW